MKLYLDMAAYKNLMKLFLGMGLIPLYMGLQVPIGGLFITRSIRGSWI